MSLLAELKRRNVIRVAGLYLVAAWLVVQVSSTILPMFSAPEWLPRAVVILLAAGFIPALVFAWIFELTPEGVKRESEVERSESITANTARRMERQFLVVLALALAYFAFDKFVLAPRREASIVASTTQAVRADVAAAEKKAAGDASIAVLPFADMSPTHDQEYLSDGMAEELLDALAKVPGLKVAGRTSSFYFKGRNEPLDKIGVALGVAHVLEGSVRKQGDKVRITAQLIQTSDGFHLWSQSYDGDLSDVFKLQESIAAAITSKLKLVLGRSGQDVKKRTVSSADAHEQMLRGRYLFRQRGHDNLLAAVAAYQAAIKLDEDYAEAWAGLAQALVVIPAHPRDNERAVEADFIANYRDAIAAADRALALDPESSAALAARGLAREVLDLDWRGAEDDFRAAIAANEHDVTARQWYAELLVAQRRWAESEAQFAAALAIDPLAAIVIFSRGMLRYYHGDLDDAIASFDAALKLVPDLLAVQNSKIAALIDLRRYDEAKALIELKSEPTRSLMLAFIAGLRDPARKQEAVAQVMKNDIPIVVFKPSHLAQLGAHDLALDELEREFDSRAPFRELLWCMPSFEPLHGHPRFQALLRRINLSPDGKPLPPPG
jgi:TolB-like protein